MTSLADDLTARTQALHQSGQDPELLALLERLGLRLARLEVAVATATEVPA